MPKKPDISITRCYTPRPEPRDNWRDEAACKNAPNPHIFFSELERNKAEARRICLEECPVRPHCLWEAIDTLPEFGIWGGADYPQLVRFRKMDGAA